MIENKYDPSDDNDENDVNCIIKDKNMQNSQRIVKLMKLKKEKEIKLKKCYVDEEGFSTMFGNSFSLNFSIDIVRKGVNDEKTVSASIG